MSDDPSAGPSSSHATLVTGDGLVQRAVAELADGPGVPGPSATAGGVSDSPALSRTSKHSALISKADSKIRRKATDIVLSALRAPELSDHPPDAVGAALAGISDPPPGWTKRQMRIALDATNSLKAAPAYLGMAAKILDSYKKAEGDKSPTPTINAGLVQINITQSVTAQVRVLEED